jgi:hypothetical protein
MKRESEKVNITKEVKRDRYIPASKMAWRPVLLFEK